MMFLNEVVSLLVLVFLGEVSAQIFKAQLINYYVETERVPLHNQPVQYISSNSRFDNGQLVFENYHTRGTDRVTIGCPDIPGVNLCKDVPDEQFPQGPAAGGGFGGPTKDKPTDSEISTPVLCALCQCCG